MLLEQDYNTAADFLYPEVTGIYTNEQRSVIHKLAVQICEKRTGKTFGVFKKHGVTQ